MYMCDIMPKKKSGGMEVKALIFLASVLREK